MAENFAADKSTADLGRENWETDAADADEDVVDDALRLTAVGPMDRCCESVKWWWWSVT